MRVLVIYCHPVPESFCAAVRDTALVAIKARGDEVRLIDLYAEDFDPVMPSDQRRSYNDAPPADPALQPHIDSLRWAEALVFVYPTWWYGLPAMLKGWLDRVWGKEVAFTLSPQGRLVPLMGHIQKIAVVTTCGAPRWWSMLIGHPGKKTILRGIRALCARRCRTMFLAHYLMDASTQESRARFLARLKTKMQRF